MLYVLYCVFALIVGVSVRRPIGALVEARRQQANLRRALAALEAAPAAGEPGVEHLSPALARLFEETRMLQAALEEPLQAVRAWVASDRNPWLARVDMSDGSDRDRLEEVDVALVNARRAVWDWLAAVAALPEADRETLERLGLSAGTVRRELEERDAFRRTSTLAVRESARVEQMIGRVRAALDRFESGLSRATRSPLYR
ncbi:MAG TPA: hypothetical protein VIK91_23300 [Nannocystis sp.]